MASCTDSESNVIKPDENIECSEDNAVEVIGPVDNGERMIAKKGERREVNGRLRISKRRSRAIINVAWWKRRRTGRCVYLSLQLLEV